MEARKRDKCNSALKKSQQLTYFMILPMVTDLTQQHFFPKELPYFEEHKCFGELADTIFQNLHEYM